MARVIPIGEFQHGRRLRAQFLSKTVEGIISIDSQNGSIFFCQNLAGGDAHIVPDAFGYSNAWRFGYLDQDEFVEADYFQDLTFLDSKTTKRRKERFYFGNKGICVLLSEENKPGVADVWVTMEKALEMEAT